MKVVTVKTLLILFCCVFVCIGQDITCKDEDGNAVDWFIVYKFPRIKTSSNVVLQQGLGYVYLDSENQKWQTAVSPLNTSSGAIYHTMQQMYDNHLSQDVAYVLYNDETPEKNVSFTRGHTKGDLAFDMDTGFWMVHSLPRFPMYTIHPYFYPYTGTYFGQTFLCMTLDTNDLDSIGTQLLYSNPQVYDYNLPASFAEMAPDLAQVVQHGHHVKKAPWWNSVELTTIGGQTFKSFAKYNHFGRDLYDSLVAPTLGVSLYVETWLRGGPTVVMPSNCSVPNKVYNVRKLSVDSVNFDESSDHSKWAISTNQHKPWVCIGDINRMYSQEHRGGGTVCVEDPAVWQAFNSSIVAVEACPRPRPSLIHILKK